MTKVQVVDFFSGCGGTSYGFASARPAEAPLTYDIRGAVDLDAHANATYERMLGVKPLHEDIRSLAQPERLRQAERDWHIQANRPMLLIGCSPCQGFSSHRKKDGRSDARDDLVEVFADVCLALRPDLVVMENVPEMLQASHWNHFEAWKNLMEDAGYRVRVQIHNLASFGVPQERFRALVIAARDWRYFSMPQPTHLPSRFRTVRDAIAHLPPIAAGHRSSEDPMHITSKHRPETVELLSKVPKDGGSRRDLPAGYGPDCLRAVDGFRDVYGRLAWNRPSVAITARCRTPSCGRFAHPEQDRGLSVREAALLQGFPEDFEFSGPFDDKYKQIGNAVSPMFAKAVAEHLALEWFADHDDPRRESDLDLDVKEPLAKSFSSSIASIKRRMRSQEDRTLAEVG